MKVFIIGANGGTHIGSSFLRAAEGLGHTARLFDMYDAWSGSRWLNALAWRFNDRLPVHISAFEAQVLEAARNERPDLIVATGASPLRLQALVRLKDMGVRVVNFSPDDPWNRKMRSKWYLRALPVYDAVFTPRRSNMADFQALGCAQVHYLPFAFDPQILQEGTVADLGTHDVLFVGGGDADRVAFVRDLLRHGITPALVGGFWERWDETAPLSLGTKKPGEVAELTRNAKTCLILVRRANRDGHVMRSFEAAAIGGCLAVEDTPEHREIFGDDGECVRYFTDAAMAAVVCRQLNTDPLERLRLSRAVRARITGNRHSYSDRFQYIIGISTA